MAVMKADKEYMDKCIEAIADGYPECPVELQRTETLEYRGFNCKVYYNYVPPYSYGVRPCNVWWGYAEGRGRDIDYNWTCPLNENVKTVEEACIIIKPVFEKAIDRLLKRLANETEDST